MTSKKIVPYKCAVGENGKFYPKGPGNGLDHYSGTLYSELRYNSEYEAMKATNIANIAFNEGIEHQQRIVLKVLGIKL
jgi:hypothetical protein